jgi:dipeptidase E
MVNKNILALSSSRVGDSKYLEKALPLIIQFLGERSLSIAFISFAFVDENNESLIKMVKDAFASTSYTITPVNFTNAKEIIEKADVIMVSGGNTFKLLHNIYQADIFNLIKTKVNSGTPYIGWSAGSNITGATICTTNDMPIIQPQSFKALEFFPFQINPHYYNVQIEGFNGETRDQRLEEFLKLNPGQTVLGLPEGTALLLRNNILQFIGITEGVRFTKTSNEPVSKTSIPINADLSYLMK